MEQCFERYLDVANIARAKLKTASTPSLDERTIADSDFEELGELSSIAAEVFMNILCAARMVRFGILQLVTSLAREVSRWNRACDKMLFRVARYINSMLNVNVVSHIGDPMHECRLLLFTDSYFAGDTRSSKSTTGLRLVLVGPRTLAPIAVAPTGQTAASHSSQRHKSLPWSTLSESQGYQCSFWGINKSCLCAPLAGAGHL